jgi:uncharacterized protein
MKPESLEIFSIPIGDVFLLYAPLNGLAALVDEEFFHILRTRINHPDQPVDQKISDFLKVISSKKTQIEGINSGLLRNPLFLGLITTRGCNMACKYCDFAAPKNKQRPMGLKLAKNCVDAYMDLITQNNIDQAEIQFFGGEPFFQNTVVEFTTLYARERAKDLGIQVHFEITTNGIIEPDRAKWVSENLDAVVLSLDGPEIIQNLHRPLPNQRESFSNVYQTAKILSEGPSELIIRTCVSEIQVDHVMEIADWIAQNFICSTVCFEALVPSECSRKNGINPPDPVKFGINVIKTSSILEKYGIDTVTSGTDINRIQKSFCPVGKDALIVDPSGKVNACYLLPEDWQKEGLDLSFGQVVSGSQRSSFLIDYPILDTIRSLAETKGDLCESCFCKYHCSGACHVNHKMIRTATDYDPVCIQTRIITLGKLLNLVESHQIRDHWLEDYSLVSNSISHVNDYLL